MSAISPVLAAVDFSDESRRAARRAALVASEQGARLELLHVVSSASAATMSWQRVSGTPYRAKIPNEIGRPWAAEIPALTTLAEAPIRVAFPPSVPANIMATKTGSVVSGQSVKAGPRAISGTSSAATK